MQLLQICIPYFHNAEHRHFHLLEHHDTFLASIKAISCGVSHHHRAGNSGMRPAPALAEYPRFPAAYPAPDNPDPATASPVTSASRLTGHWAAPYHRVIVSHQIADRVGRRAVRHNRRHMRTVRDVGRRSSLLRQAWLGSTDRKYRHREPRPSHLQPLTPKPLLPPDDLPTPPYRAHGTMFFTPLMPAILTRFSVAMLYDSFQSIAFAPVMQQIGAGSFNTSNALFQTNGMTSFNVQRIIHPCDVVQRLSVVSVWRFRLGAENSPASRRPHRSQGIW